MKCLIGLQTGNINFGCTVSGKYIKQLLNGVE